MNIITIMDFVFKVRLEFYYLTEDLLRLDSQNLFKEAAFSARVELK
jgi:hypothetical protein